MKIEAEKPFVVVLYNSDQNGHYGHSWYSLVKSIRNDCDYLDIDQNSDKGLLENIRKAITEARPLILLIDAENFSEAPAGFSMLADTMLRNAPHCYAVLKGEQELIKKWLTPLGDHLILYTNEETLEVKLKQLLNQDFQD